MNFMVLYILHRCSTTELYLCVWYSPGRLGNHVAGMAIFLSQPSNMLRLQLYTNTPNSGLGFSY